ncbi:MAG: UvrD-helicase domain-containing protein [Pseudomonadota bacterium]
MSNPPVPDEAARDLALDPQRSCIVQAPAGSGKTTLLAQRYVNLLVRVQRPEEILAITFTKKAAAEMRHRVLALLHSDTEQNRQIRQRDAELQWHLFTNPHVLKIQTIDSFAMQLASRTPNLQQAGIRIETNPAPIYAAATDAFIGQLLRNNTNATLIAEFIAFMGNDISRVQRLLVHMLGRRDQWQQVVTSVAASSRSGRLSSLLNEAIQQLQDAFTSQLQAQLNEADRAQLQLLSSLLGTNNLRDTVAPMLTNAGALRKRISPQQVPDKAQRQHLSEWLKDLHERDLAGVFATFGKLPALLTGPDTTTTVSLCCICLSLVLIELDTLFSNRGITDFPGLLLQAQEALRDETGPTDLALYLDSRIQHLLIDEFQDTSRSQAEFFGKLIEEWSSEQGNTVFLVGDPMQSIYRFRDADVAIFTETQQRGLGGVPLERVALSANFRSAAPLVHWCNYLFASQFGHATQAVSGTLGEVPHNPAEPMSGRPGGKVESLQFDDSDAEIEYLTAHIEACLAADSGCSVAVLCRARQHITPLLAHLQSTGIEYQATDMDSLADKPVISDLMSLYQVLLTPAEQLPWHALLRCPMFGCTLGQLSAWTADQLFPAALQNGEAHHKRLFAALQWAQAQLHEVPLREVLEGCWIRCGGMSAYTADEHRDARAWFDLVEDLQHAAYELETVTLALAELYASSATNAQLQVMTIHKAKGLEFDHVVVPNLSQRSRPDELELLSWRPYRQGLLMGAQGDDIHRWLRFEEQQRARNEEKRLLYVACTRARQSLVVSYVGDKPAGLAALLQHTASAAPNVSVNSFNHTNPQQQLFHEQTLRRLDPNYRWQPPPYPALPAAGASATTADLIGDRDEVMLGNLVHRALAWFAEAPLARRPAWPAQMRRWAIELGATASQLEPLFAAATRQMQTTLADADGEWLLSPLPQAASELALSARDGLHIVLDRTFVSKGERWIVDYKTAQPSPGTSKAAFVTTQVNRYRPQLSRYKGVAAGLFPEPIRLALYFTALGHLEEISSE